MINFDKFVDWCESRFDGDIVVKNKEVRINSIFCEDNKHHLWCNPTGGKKERPYGVYHCWKTDNKGSLVSLIMTVDHCTFEEAMDVLDGHNLSMAAMDKALDELYAKKWGGKAIEENPMSFPPETYSLYNLPEDNYFRNLAELYLQNRKIPVGRMMVCTSDVLWYNISYYNRLIIPYFDREGNLIYFNGRYLGENKKILNGSKYLGPPKETGTSKEDVIYMPHWPKSGEMVYYCEGELDSESIVVAGLHSGAWGGKAVSEKQALLMQPYLPVIGFDNDNAGKKAMPLIADFLKARGFNRIWFVRPPTKYKDWNELLVDLGPNVLRTYLIKNTKLLDDAARITMDF